MGFENEQLIAVMPNIDRYAHSLIRYNEEDAEDLVQDSCVKALAYRDKFQDGTNLCNWVIMLTHNLFIDYLRKRGRKAPITELSETVIALNPTGWVYQNTEIRAMLHEATLAIKNLPPDQRRVLILSIDEIPDKEISRLEGIPIATVRTRLWRAREKLRRDPIEPQSTEIKPKNKKVVAADKFAGEVLPIIEAIRAEGVITLKGIAEALNEQNVSTLYGGQWRTATVTNVLKRGRLLH